MKLPIESNLPPTSAQNTIQHQEGTFSGAGNLTLYYQSWHPSTQPRSIVIIVHGLGAHSGWFANSSGLVSTTFSLTNLRDDFPNGQISPEHLNTGYIEGFKRYGETQILDRVVQIDRSRSRFPYWLGFENERLTISDRAKNRDLAY
jgi:hypothetical protein